MRVTLTAEERAAYLGAGGRKCPKCWGDDVTGARLDADGPVAYGRCRCDDCGAEWVDEFRLVGVGEVDESTDDDEEDTD
jgi:hypothetical protein